MDELSYYTIQTPFQSMRLWTGRVRRKGVLISFFYACDQPHPTHHLVSALELHKVRGRAARTALTSLPWPPQHRAPLAVCCPGPSTTRIAVSPSPPTRPTVPRASGTTRVKPPPRPGTARGRTPRQCLGQSESRGTAGPAGRRGHGREAVSRQRRRNVGWALT